MHWFSTQILHGSMKNSGAPNLFATRHIPSEIGHFFDIFWWEEINHSTPFFYKKRWPSWDPRGPWSSPPSVNPVRVRFTVPVLHGGEEPLFADELSKACLPQGLLHAVSRHSKGHVHAWWTWHLKSGPKKKDLELMKMTKQRLQIMKCVYKDFFI